MGKFFDFLKKKQPQQSNDPGGYKAMPYGSFKQDYISDGWGFGGGQSNKNREEAVRAAQAQQQMPQVDPNNAMQSLVQLLGPTPAEREAQERKLLENKRKMIAWTGLFDGLRQLGNLYYASKGATPQQYTDKPYQTIEQNYMQERQLQDYLNRYSQAYAKQLYDFKRQADQDVIRKEAHQAQMNWRKSQEDDLKEKRRQTEEKNQAVIKYYDALEKKNEEQAAYWKAKAEGYPDEVAARIAKYNRTGGGGKSDSQGTETIVEEYIDDKTGRKVKKTVKQPKQGSSSPGNGKKTYDNTKKLGL